MLGRRGAILLVGRGAGRRCAVATRRGRMSVGRRRDRRRRAVLAALGRVLTRRRSGGRRIVASLGRILAGWRLLVVAAVLRRRRAVLAWRRACGRRVLAVLGRIGRSAIAGLGRRRVLLAVALAMRL